MLHNISGGAGARQWLAGITLVIVGGLGFITSGYAASLDPKVLPVIQAATFEVVSAKPGQDPLQYERPLPFDLLPFQERNDKYYSIGTAFAIGGGRYVTAAHVLLTGANSLWGPPALRDSHGRVYAIDKVRKFSLEKDFVVFTLTEQPGDAALLLDTSAVQGQTVYSVGNAYGTGVVIRDGLYTSDTPEDQDGRWKWVRFSAPASPGNSGGPLVDQDGKVVAIVLAKSPNENLNYGLPIGMVQAAADGVAEFDQRIPYQFDVFDSTLSDTLKSQFALPLSLDAFFDLYQQRTNAYFDKELKALLAKEPQRTFPNGDGASELLHQVASMEDFPKVIARNSSGTWVLAGEANDNIKLSSNGYVTPGAFGKNSLFHLRRPDDVPADRLYGDAAVPMDLLLKSGFIKRQIGTQNIEVTSLGKPTLQSIHLDAWGRRWQVWEWPLPYANAILLVLALPVPDGYVGVMRYSLAGSEHDQMINTTALTDFMYVNYDGTLAQWKEYLRHADLLPVAFHDIHIDIDYGRRFRYASSRVHFDVTPDVQAVQPDSVLTLGFSYFPDHGKAVWDVAEVWLSAKATDNNYVMFVREQVPPPALGDDYKSDWDKLVNRQHPYDAMAHNDKDATKISSVGGPPATAAPAILYGASFSAEGMRPQEAMKAKLDLLLGTLQVEEH